MISRIGPDESEGCMLYARREPYPIRVLHVNAIIAIPDEKKEILHNSFLSKESSQAMMPIYTSKRRRGNNF
jgi:hypothetical protein